MGAIRLGIPTMPTCHWSAGDVYEFCSGWLGLPSKASEYAKVTYDSSTGRSWLARDPDLRFFAVVSGNTGYAFDYYPDERERTWQDLIRQDYTIAGDCRSYQEALGEAWKHLRGGRPLVLV